MPKKDITEGVGSYWPVFPIYDEKTEDGTVFRGKDVAGGGSWRSDEPWTSEPEPEKEEPKHLDDELFEID
jgi:hypothetical protein